MRSGECGSYDEVMGAVIRRATLSVGVEEEFEELGKMKEKEKEKGNSKAGKTIGGGSGGAVNGNGSGNGKRKRDDMEGVSREGEGEPDVRVPDHVVREGVRIVREVLEEVVEVVSDDDD